MKKAAFIAASFMLAPPIAPALAQPVADPAPAAQAEIDPARLAAAQVTVNHIFPEGTYARLMNGSFDAIMKSVMNSVGAIPVKQLAAMGGLREQEVARLGNGTLQEMMDIVDPAYRQRTEIVMHTLASEMPKLMTTFEPGMREGLSRAYARRYTVDQLADLNRFFATPTGSAYAADSMVMMMDPEVMSRMQAIMPEMMRQMPAIMQKAQAATASLPAPRRPEQLSKAERAKLARLLGIPESQLGRTPPR